MSRRRVGFSFSDLCRETGADLRRNKLRSALTMLGIAWGVASLIILVGVGEGMRLGQLEKSRLLGKDILIVWGGSTSIPGPGMAAGRRVFLTVEDYEAVKANAYLLGKVSPELEQNLTCVTPLNRGSFDVSGVLTDYQDIRTLEVAKGRLMTALDMENAARVCLVGDEVNKQIFGGSATPGDEMAVNGLKYRVVGVLARKEQNSNYSGPDNFKVFAPYPAIRRDFPYADNPMGDRALADLIAQAVSLDKCEAAEQQIREVLGRRHGFDPLDRDAMPCWNTATQGKMMNAMFDSMKLFMSFVAVVTLILGGIGVMNIMLVSVRSRTREIGLRKALGATRRNILTHFFFQALLISLGSGLVGYLGATALCGAVNSLRLPDFFAGMIVPPWMGPAAFGFLTAISLAAAFYPSFSAANLDPVEALRFEE